MNQLQSSGTKIWKYFWVQPFMQFPLRNGFCYGSILISHSFPIALVNELALKSLIPNSFSSLTSQRTPAFEVERALPWRGSDEQTWKAPQCTGSESPRRTVRARSRTRGTSRAPGPHQKAPYQCCRPIPYQRTASRFRGTVWALSPSDVRHC